MNKRKGNKRYERARRRRQRLLFMTVIGLLLCVGVGVAAVKLVMTTFAREKAVITIMADPITIRQEQEIPKLTANILVSGDEEAVLDKKSGYTVGDLVKEIRKGEHYQIENKADNTTEGTFALKVTLTKEMKKKLDNQFKNKVEIKTQDGTLVVKNKYGDWEGKKFKKADGNYAVSEFVAMGDKKYYFDEEGNMVTGEMKQGNKEYVFSDTGVLESEKFIGLDPTKPMVALTFDDGPGKDTDRLLEALKKYNARATFFMLGNNAKNYGSVIKKMKDMNCELGNHSTTHAQLTKLSAEAIKKEIQTTSEYIKNAAGVGPTVMRPPYGAVNATVKQNVGLPMILWSVDTLDWKTKSTPKTVESIMTAKDGDIILLHDIHTTSVDAAIEAIPKLIEKGFQLVTVSEMAEAKGQKLELGVKYFSF